ncbi:GNAT family N-acetyltransferase [Lichenihabitans sp. Uapishka_5]|uniref:GNAT family N-acetyltransferase n=1 Tax=Lichenihabitans sp. Uapishka_5 TaxID=3037302 RepID=UPI0029E80A25|nr:GNAT family N-acetyltransferase [Lichenihabitans sp. Uapishka_5]MDX7951434.1 GNAT family N-acetyltransferase [Lichenihabitans sp. Uapishka_5]
MAEGARIRDAVPDDLDAVEALEDRVFTSDELSRRSLRYYLGARTAHFLVLEQEGAIIGDAIVAFRRGSRAARLYSVAVHPDHAGHGHGRRLLAASEAAAIARGATLLRLEVRADNAPAIALYRADRYREFGRYEDYYEDGTAALRFEKALAAAPQESA